MHLTRIVLVIVAFVGVFSAVPIEASRNDAALPSTKPLTKCPRHYSKHREDLGSVWCMDSSGRNYSPENARAVAKIADEKSHPKR